MYIPEIVVGIIIGVVATVIILSIIGRRMN